MNQDKIIASAKIYMKHQRGCDTVLIRKCSKTQSCCSPLYECFVVDEKTRETFRLIMTVEYQVIHCMPAVTLC